MVTDRQTNRQTDGQTYGLTLAAHSPRVNYAVLDQRGESEEVTPSQEVRLCKVKSVCVLVCVQTPHTHHVEEQGLLPVSW